jgi:hypothetical protein
MKRILSGAIAAIGTLALTGGTFAATALPAAAASPNVAYAAGASGLLGSLQPLGEASYPGTSPVTLAQVNVLGLITAGVATDTAGPTSASSSIANVAVLGVLGLGSANITAVSSSCAFSASTNTLTGTASIVGGQVATGLIPVTLPTNPAPNTTITVPGLATITLNKQVSTGGTLQVDALSVSLLGGLETITLGTSICNAAVLTAP